MQRICYLFVVLFVLCTFARAEDAAGVEKRIFETARYLASDELEGRGLGSQGLDLAAEHIAEQFRQLGLKTQLFDGTPFQKFEVTTGAKLGEGNDITLVGPSEEGRRKLNLGEDYTPLALGGSGTLDLPLVFVGYGITAKKENYDDYAGIDVKDKCVIVLRHEPQQDNPHSVFEGNKTSAYAPFMRKISNAYEHGAAAVIFVTDEFEIRKNVAERRKRWQEAIDKLVEDYKKFQEINSPTREQLEEHRRHIDDLAAQVRSQGDKLAAEYDPLMRFDAGGLGGDGRESFPVLFMRRAALETIVKSALDRDLADLERTIDKGPTPHSRDLPGWRIKGTVSVERTRAEVRNVVAVLDGEGDLAHENVIVGAHYDHVGRGGPGSGAIDSNSREIHNGADDNASGTAALIEVARQMAASQSKPRRRVVFIAFTGEERGLLGSDYYVKNPLFKLEDTAAMLNMDMVGRLVDDKLIVEGVGTGAEFDALLDRVNERYGFKLTKLPRGAGPSDHASFYLRKVPVLHFFTGTHKDYHRPGDDYDKLNVSGMRRIGEMVTEIAMALAEDPARPTYKEVASSQRQGGGGSRPYFGSIPDFAQDQPGYALNGVAKESPAEKAGLKGGDIIIRLGESRIGNLEDFDSALRKYKAGDRVPVVVKRDGKEVTLQVTLAPPRE
jgi:hypothetical protein